MIANKENVRVLSIRQPWAWLIVHGLKSVENRSWNTNYRGKVLIHASKMMDRAGARWVQEKFPEITLPAFTEGINMGGLVGSCILHNVVKKSDDPLFTGPFGFELSHPVWFQNIIPCPGKLGFFNLANDITVSAEAFKGRAVG